MENIWENESKCEGVFEDKPFKKVWELVRRERRKGDLDHEPIAQKQPGGCAASLTEDSDQTIFL